MTQANVVQRSVYGLPPSLATAQDAIYLPEVQEILRKLADYNLGIFMPHMHDESTGEFQPLPAGVMQVESGLQVSFPATGEVASQAIRFLPVGWSWRAGASEPVAVCEMVSDENPRDAERSIKHKMKIT